MLWEDYGREEEIDGSLAILQRGENGFPSLYWIVEIEVLQLW